MEVEVSLAQREVGQSPAAGSPRLRAGQWATWLVLGCYLLASVVLTWHLWISPATMVQRGNISDVDLFAWFMRYDGVAVAHGHLPALVTTALNYPRGVNLMWNTSFLLPGVVLAPVTLLAGPQVSLTVMLTLGFAGSAASLFWVLRRWGASTGAAALGGAVYGFSPALMTAVSHYHLEFAVLPPLIIDAALRIITGQGSAVRNGIWLGVLTAAQVFTGEELLVITAVAGGVLAAVLALSTLAGQAAQARLGSLLTWHSLRRLPARCRGPVTGLVIAGGVTLLLSGYALYIQFLGPLHQHGSPWKPAHFINYLPAFVLPTGKLLFHTQASAAYAASDPVGTTEYLAYLGAPLLLVLLTALIVCWRDPKVRVTALSFAVLEVFTLGGRAVPLAGWHYPGVLLPWHWLAKLPVLSQVLPDRFSLLAAGVAAAALAFTVDRARPAAAGTAWWRRGIPAAVAAVAVLPLIPLPLRAAAPPAVPVGWRAAFTRLNLPASAPVLIVPIPWGHASQVMRWQAETGVPGTMNAGYFIGSNEQGQAKSYGTRRIRPIATLVDGLWAGTRVAPDSVTTRKLRSDIAYWRPAAVVAVTSRTTRIGRLLITLLGQPTFQSGRVLAWRR
jgi:dolichyl-phosphate beta-glucosyltransferase